jgi:metallo-beta-lactamase class B
MRRNIFLIAAFLISHLFTFAQVKEPAITNKEWTKPYPSFRIAGNLYYVGTYDLACYLITTAKGHILINTGTAASLRSIKTNIESLGFSMKDIKILLISQAHYDHTGALSAIKKMTGAKFLVNANDSAVMADGGRSDYELGKLGTSFAPVIPDGVLHNRDSIKLGETKLVMLHHPGHTKGSASYLLDVKDENKTYRVLIANLPTIISDRKFSEIHSYPRIAKDFAYTLKQMKQLNFDIWVAAHASQFDLHTKHRPGAAYNPSAFADRKGYDAALKELQLSYDTKMKNN